MKRVLSLAALALFALPAAALAHTPSKAASTNCKAQLRVMGKTNFQHTYVTFGRCVSRMASLPALQQQATLNSAQKCRAEQRANPAAFTAKYGSNTNKANAFGKCVSRTAKASNNGVSGGNRTVSAKKATGNFTFTAGTVANRHVVFDVHTARGHNPAGGLFSYSDASSSYTLKVNCVAISATTVYIGGLVQNATGFNPPLASPTYLLAKGVDNGASGDTYSGSFTSTDPCPTLGTVNPADGPFTLASGNITVG
jgi:hypothetical protein